MNDSPAAIIAQLLINNMIFGDPEVSGPIFPVYINLMPDNPTVPDDIGAVFDTEGVKDGRQMNDGENVFHRGVQVRVRSLVNDEGFLKISSVEETLERVLRTTVTVNGFDYVLQNVSQISPALSLGREVGTKQRSLFSANWLMTFYNGGEGAAVSVVSRAVNLTSGVAATLLSVPLPVGSRKGGRIDIVIECSDGTDNQLFSGRMVWVAENKGGVVSYDVQVFGDNPAGLDSAGTSTGLTLQGVGDSVSAPGYFNIQIKASSQLAGITTFIAHITPTGWY